MYVRHPFPDAVQFASSVGKSVADRHALKQFSRRPSVIVYSSLLRVLFTGGLLD